MRNYVIINGVNSLDIKGLAISKLPSISKPPLRVMTEEIDGRDGDIITELGYGSYDKELVIGLYENYDINEIIGFFNQEGTIVFSNEDDKYYNFKIINQIDYEALIKFRTANVTLHCQPFKYPLEEEPIELIDTYVEEEGEELTLTPTEEAPMKIDLKGNASQEVISGETGTEVEGTSISVNDVVPTKEDYITLKGNTSQVQYTGKNLLPNTRNVKTPISLPSGTKLVLSTKDGVVSEGGNVKLYKQDDTVVWFPIEAGDTTATKTLASDIYYIENALNGTIEYQCETGTTKTSYEPYCGGTPSPNPNYPQDIHSVSGDNEIEVCGENLFDKNSPYIVNGYLNANGSITTNASYRVSNYMYIGNFSKITIAGNIENGLVYCFYDENKTLLGANSISGSTKTITPPTNTKYIRTTISASGLDSYMVVEGETAPSEYIPYTGNTYPIYLGVENLFNVNTIEEKNINPTTGAITDNSYWRASDYIKVQPNTSYISSWVNGTNAQSYVKAIYYDNSKTFISGISSDYISITNFSFTTPNNCQYVRYVYLVIINDTPAPKSNIQLEKGTKANHYTPYGTTPITLNKIGSYQDYIYKSGSKWYLHKEFGKVVYDGDETFTIYNSSATRTVMQTPAITNLDSSSGTTLYAYLKSNHFIGVSQAKSWVEGDMAFRTGSSSLYLTMATGYTLETFSDYLKDNNVEIIFPLATPTNTEITDSTLISQLNDLYTATIYGTTNISSIPNDLEPFIKLRYNVITPSPSPERPSAIEVVSGTNTIKIANEDDTESQTFNIRLGSLKLYKLNDTQDYIYKSGDKWYIRNHAKEKTFTGAGSEGWGCFQNGRGEWCILTTNIRNEVKQGSSLIADILPFFSSAIFNGLYNQNAITLGGKNIELMIEGINENDDELFTDFLAIHNLTILYELATPIDTEITDTDLLEDLEALLEATSYNPETNITQTSNDKPFIIYAKALEGGSGEAEVINVGNIYAKPIFEIEGTGEVQVLIDNNEVLQVDTTNDTIIIDTENMEAINKSDNTLANRQVIGDYSKIKIVPGENDIKLTGNYTKGTITKYTRYL